MAEKKAVKVVISGKVQGVFFRMETARAAEKHQVTGWVRNRSDGAVEAFFQGPPSQVDAMVQWCWKGPPAASVTEVAVEEKPVSEEFSDFSIRHTG